MDRSQKADLVDELKSVFTETSVVVVTRNLGLTVAQSGNRWAFVEPRPVRPVDILELAWIVRKKRIWSTS